MNISTITIIISAALLLIAVLSPLVSAWFRRALPPAQEGMSEGGESCQALPPVTILLTPHNDADVLERTLPALLSQDYEAGLRVVVVYWRGDSEVEDVLKRNASNDRLYYTYIPESSRYMSREKLAITVGVKAAQTDWIVMMASYCEISSDQWLKSFATSMSDDVHLVLGCTALSDDAPVLRRFHHALTSRYMMRRAIKGTAVSTCSPLLAFRKSDFDEQEGFRGNLEFARGEFEFLVNKYADYGNSTVAASPDSWLTESTLPSKQWQARRLSAINASHSMQRLATLRCLKWVDGLALHLPLVAFVAFIVGSAFCADWLVCAVASFSLILTFCLRAFFGGRGLKEMHCHVSSWKVPFLEIADSLAHIGWLIRYIKVDKLDFITHKL